MNAARPIAACLALACASPGTNAPPPATPAVATSPAVAPAPASLTGTTWHWVRTVDPVRTWTPDDPARYTLRLLADGAAEVLADCNRGRGRYVLDGSRIEIGPLAITRMACPPGSLDAAFLRQLGGVRSVAIVAGLLRAEQLADSGTMWFAADPGARVASYACAGGRRAWAVYGPGRASVLAGPDALDRAEARSASGARYEAGDAAWITKGEEARLERAGRVALADCRVAAEPEGKDGE